MAKVTHLTTATAPTDMSTTGAARWNEEHTGTADAGGFAFKYIFTSGAWAGAGDNPTTGKFKMNHTSPESCTSLIIYETDAGGVVLDPVLDLVNPTDFIMLSNGDKSIYHVYNVPLPFVSGVSIDTLPVRWICGTGNAGGTTNFTNNDIVFITIQHADFDDVMGCVYAMSRGIYLN